MRTTTNVAAKRPARILATLTTMLAAVLAAGAHAQPCVDFQGIDHCPLGDASLVLTPEGLELVKVGGAGVAAGVTSQLPAGTAFWASELAFDPQKGPGPWMLTSAIADGGAVARLRLDEVDPSYLQTVPGVINGYLVNLGFSVAATGSTYSVLVYDDGVLQGAVGGVASDDHLLQTTVPTDDVPHPWDIIIFDWPGTGPFLPGPGDDDDPFPGDDDGPTTTFGIDLQSGGCFFSMSNAAGMHVQLPNGALVPADEIRFVEEVSLHNVYPDFHGMETVIGGDRMTIVNEAVGGL
ncbi:MAG: hypothetical protein AAGN66_29215 [Acidobacteriota bacterium]